MSTNNLDCSGLTFFSPPHNEPRNGVTRACHLYLNCQKSKQLAPKEMEKGLISTAPGTVSDYD